MNSSRTLLLAVVAGTAAVAIAVGCDKANPKTQTAGLLELTANPTCGSAGDAVSLTAKTVYLKCEDTNLFLGFSVSVPATIDSIAEVSTTSINGVPVRTCALTTTVPSSAQTGPIHLSYNGATSSDVDSATFSIPCANPTPTVRGVFHADESAANPGQTSLQGAFYEAGTTSSQANLWIEILRSDLGPVRPEGIAKGTCATSTPTPTPADPSTLPAHVAAGDLTLSTNGNAVITASSVNTPDGPQYAGSASISIADHAFGLSWVGSGAYPAATLDTAGFMPPLASLISPPTSAPLSFGSGDQTITYAGAGTTDISLEIRPSGGTNMTCVLDPAASSFVIPDAVFGGMMSGSYTLRFGNLVEAPNGSDEIVTISTQTRTGTWTRP